MWIWCTKLCCTYSWFRYLDDWMTSSFTRYFTMCYQPPNPSHINPSHRWSLKFAESQRVPKSQGRGHTKLLEKDVVYEMFSATGTLYRKKLITNTCVILLIMFMTQMSTKWMAAIGTLSHISRHRCIWCLACSFLFDIKHNCNSASFWLKKKLNITMFVVFMETFW